MVKGNSVAAVTRGMAGFAYPAAVSWIAFLVFILLAPAPAHAKNYALLIGVSNYTNKDIAPLKGPANDVTLMWRALGKRGFSDVTVLADALPSGAEFPKSSGNPTRAAILNALATLGQRAAAGDLVLIYFSGHGTEQPVRNTNQDPERGNLDQVMLPIDAGGWDRATETVVNGIVDDEIGAALDKVRARGADAWVIIDACHAGSMTRGVFDGLAVRGIDGARLGIPRPAPTTASRAANSKSSQFLSKPASANEGSLVEFFAVDSSREAIERSFDEFARPMAGQGADRRMGVFTYFLYRALTDSSGRIASYRDLAHHVVREMQQSTIAPPAMPTFGGALDRQLLSIGKAPPPAAWEVTLNANTVEIPAGALHGVTDKSVLKLTASPAPDAPQWAQATVTKADPISAVAEISGRVPAAKPQALWARVATPGVSFALKVAQPPASDLTDAAARRLLDETKAQAAKERQGAIDWVGDKDAADVRLRAHSGKLWILPADGEWVREDLRRDVPKLKAFPLTPSFPVTSSASVGSVADALHKIARARNMVRLAEMAHPERSGGNPWKAIEVTAERIASPGDDKNPQRACPARLPAADVKGRAIDLKLPEPVFHCDLVRITVRNNGTRDVDLNLSYIDAGSGIQKIGQDCTVTVPPNGQLVRSLWVTTWDRQKSQPDSVGREHVVITAVERKAASQTNLCFIQEAVRGVDTIRTRGGNVMPGNAGWLMSALNDAALASSGTRGVQVPDEDDAPDAPRAGMYLVTLQVTPSVGQ